MFLYDYLFIMILITFLFLFVRYGILLNKCCKSICIIGEHERIAFTFVLAIAVVMTVFTALRIMEEGLFQTRHLLLLLLLYYLLIIYLHTVSKVYFTEVGIFANNRMYRFKDIIYLKEVREDEEEVEYVMIIKPKKYKKYIRFSIAKKDMDLFSTFMIKMKNKAYKNHRQLDT